MAFPGMSGLVMSPSPGVKIAGFLLQRGIRPELRKLLADPKMEGKISISRKEL